MACCSAKPAEKEIIALTPAVVHADADGISYRTINSQPGSTSTGDMAERERRGKNKDKLFCFSRVALSDLPSMENLSGKVLDCACKDGFFLAKDLQIAPTPQEHEVIMVRTARYTKERFTVHPPLTLSKSDGSDCVRGSKEASIIVDSAVKFQTVLGFGGSFTESSADLFMAMSPEIQKCIIDAYFKQGSGLGYSIGRLHMGACDFSEGHWNCIQKGDTELATFTIERYKRSILPMIHQATIARGEPLKLMYSPWSPPPWMKDSKKMSGGKLLPEFRDAWARHFVRFAQEFEKEGVRFWGTSTNNEPGAAVPWENTVYSPEEERDFVRDFLGPALESNKLDIKILIWDWNRDNAFKHVQVIYNDPDAAKYVWGTATHWYGDPRYEWWPDPAGQRMFDNIRAVHDLRPDKHIIMSETCQEMGAKVGEWKTGERYAESVIKDLNNWLEGWIDWNLILDPIGGPNHVYNVCSAPIVVDTLNDRMIFLSHYFYFGHFSRHIQPGAQRVAAVSNCDTLETTAFLNPDGTLVAVVLNRQDIDTSFRLQFGDWGVFTQALAHSITTYISWDRSPASHDQMTSVAGGVALVKGDFVKGDTVEVRDSSSRHNGHRGVVIHVSRDEVRYAVRMVDNSSAIFDANSLIKAVHQ